MQPHSKQKVVREALVWIQYFVIALLSAVWAYDSYITKRYGSPSDGVDVNLMGLLRAMWSSYLVPWLAAFLALCALRFLLLFLSNRFGHTSKENAEGSADNRAL